MVCCIGINAVTGSEVKGVHVGVKSSGLYMCKIKAAG